MKTRVVKSTWFVSRQIWFEIRTLPPTSHIHQGQLGSQLLLPYPFSKGNIITHPMVWAGGFVELIGHISAQHLAYNSREPICWCTHRESLCRRNLGLERTQSPRARLFLLWLPLETAFFFLKQFSFTFSLLLSTFITGLSTQWVKSRRFRVELCSKTLLWGTFPMSILSIFHKQCPYFPLPRSKTIMCKYNHFEIGLA